MAGTREAAESSEHTSSEETSRAIVAGLSAFQLPSFVTPIRFHLRQGAQPPKKAHLHRQEDFLYGILPDERVPPGWSNDPLLLKRVFEMISHELRHRDGSNVIAINDSIILLCYEDDPTFGFFRNELGEYFEYVPSNDEEVGAVWRFDDPQDLDSILLRFLDPDFPDPGYTSFFAPCVLFGWPRAPRYLKPVQLCIPVGTNKYMVFYYYEVPHSKVPFGWTNNPIDLDEASLSKLHELSCQEGLEVVELDTMVPILRQASGDWYTMVNAKGEYLLCHCVAFYVWRIDWPRTLRKIFEMVTYTQNDETPRKSRSRFTDMKFTKFDFQMAGNKIRIPKDTPSPTESPILTRLQHPYRWPKDHSDVKIRAFHRLRHDFVPNGWTNDPDEIVKITMDASFLRWRDQSGKEVPRVPG